MVERTTGDKSQIVDSDGFVNGIAKVVNEAMKGANPSKIQVGTVLSKVLHLVRTHRVPLET